MASPYSPALVAVALLALLTLAGCQQVGDGIAKLIGAPTSADYAAVEAAAAAAEEEIRKADKDLEDLAAQLESMRQAEAAGATRVAALRDAQTALATQLAAAQGPTRDLLTAALRQLDEQISAELDQGAAVAAAIAGVVRTSSQLAGQRRLAEEDLDTAMAKVEQLGARASESVERAIGGIRQVGESATKLGVPGAGAISETIADGLGGVLLGLLPAAGVALRFRSQRNAGRRAMAITERHGINEIATDPAVRQAAKVELASDRAAKAELAAAKVIA